PEEERHKYVAKAEKNEESIARWAAASPANWGHKKALASAARARLRGDRLEAARLYDQAAEQAAEHRFVQDEALAHELAGEFYLELGRGRIARDSLLLAASAYRRWGAEAKVRDIERR